MKFYAKKENGVYYIDVFCPNTLSNNSDVYIGAVIIDAKRGSYYLIPTDSKKYGQNIEPYFIADMSNLFLKDLTTRINYHSRTGSLIKNAEVNVEEKLMQLLDKKGIKIVDEQEEIENKKEAEEEKYYKMLLQYNEGHYPEHKMYM